MRCRVSDSSTSHGTHPGETIARRPRGVSRAGLSNREGTRVKETVTWWPHEVSSVGLVNLTRDPSGRDDCAEASRGVEGRTLEPGGDPGEGDGHVVAS